MPKETPVTSAERFVRVRELLAEAVLQLRTIAEDPTTERSDAFCANDHRKSLARFLQKI